MFSLLFSVIKCPTTEGIGFVCTGNTKLIAFYSPISNFSMLTLSLYIKTHSLLSDSPKSPFGIHLTLAASSLSHPWSCSLSGAIISDTHLALRGICISSHKMPSSLGYTDSYFGSIKIFFAFFFLPHGYLSVTANSVQRFSTSNAMLW